MKRGWCPTLYDPMPSGDGLLVRVKPRFGRLTSGAARLLAAAGRHHGNGTIELTSRGNLQVRGLSPAAVPHFAAAMVAAGLASADPDAERRRNVSLSPLAGDDPAAAADAVDLAAAIEAMLERDPALPHLPAKFCIAVDAGGSAALTPAADLTLRTDGARHWIAAGGWQAAIDPADTLDAIRRMTLRAGGRRVQASVAEAGVPAIFAACGLVPVECLDADTRLVSGFLAYAGTLRGAFAAGLAFGQTHAATLTTLAELAERYGDGILRLGARRAILFAGVRAGDAATLAEAIAAAGLVADASDPRLRIAACIGAAGCAHGTVRPREDAAWLAGLGPVHLSGCAKGCAHPAAAPVTLVGAAGRYGIVLNGRPGDAPVIAGLSIGEAAAWLANAA